MGMEVTAFTTSMNREQELKSLGAHFISHSTNLESLKKEEKKYDIVLNTLFLDNSEAFKVIYTLFIY